MKKGSKVVIVEGPHQGMEGTVLSVGRMYDPVDSKTRKMVRITGGHKIVRERAAYVRVIEEGA